MYNITYNNKQVTNNHNLKLYKNSTEKIQQTIISKINNELLVKIYIKTTLNNMFITYNFNNKIINKSIAALGFKGKTKQTQYAYKTFAENLINELLTLTDKNSIVVNLYLKSLNKKLKPFFTIFKSNNIKINKIYDVTPIPYNGCKKYKISIKKKKKSIIKYLSY